MNIFVDTNIICKDYRLISPDFILLKELVATTESRVVTSKVVIEECINRFKEDLHDTHDRFARKLRLLLGGTGVQEMDPVAEVDSYRAYLERKLFTDFKAVVLPYPQISHEEIVRRDLNRCKPFSESGRGYRDMLIWQSFLEYLQPTTGETVFVSSNVNDFANADNTGFHRDLIADIQERTPQVDKVSFFNSLSNFNDKLVKPKLQGLNNIARELESRAYPHLSLEGVLKEAHDDIEWHITYAPLRRLLRRSGTGSLDAEDPEVSSVGSPVGIKVKQVLEMENGAIFVTFVATFPTGISTHVPKDELEHWKIVTSDRFEVFEEEMDNEDSYIEIAFEVQAAYVFKLVFDPTVKKVSSLDILLKGLVLPSGAGP